MNNKKLEQLMSNLEMAQNGNLRQKVAEFIDERPETTNFHGMKYFTYEDAVVEFIATIVNDIKEEK